MDRQRQFMCYKSRMQIERRHGADLVRHEDMDSYSHLPGVLNVPVRKFNPGGCLSHLPPSCFKRCSEPHVVSLPNIEWGRYRISTDAHVYQIEYQVEQFDEAIQNSSWKCLRKLNSLLPAAALQATLQ